MSPRRFANEQSSAVRTAVSRLWITFGTSLREARLARRWSTVQLATEAGVSRTVVFMAERGESVSVEAVVRLSSALGLRLDFELSDPRKRAPTSARQTDVVHAAMGELEAGHLRRFGFTLGLDEPYQHFQFAGRADVAAWDLAARALLHIENRTRFPDFQEMAGSYNAKRSYLAETLAHRLGIRSWSSETHVIAALWSSEVLQALRAYPESFRSICPDPPDAFLSLWDGTATPIGITSTLVLFDPAATGRQVPFVGLDDALDHTTRPRYRGYAEAAAAVGLGRRAA
jgi:transcriptional regulator with XRE-family HTH domain